jgi:uncharacterized protein (TIGR02996 family)
MGNMADIEAILAALHASPQDDVAHLALADALEEAGKVERAELTRACVAAHRGDREASERMRRLLACGVIPCVPTLTNCIGMTLVLVPPGVFSMGSAREEMWREATEKQHEVEITRGFYLGMYQVTQKQYKTVMGKNPSWFSPSGTRRKAVKGVATANFPVEHVGWKDVQAFLKKLSALPSEKQAKRRYRLPTEAEWEYACRGGAADSTPFHYGSTLTSLEANFNGSFPFPISRSPSGAYLERPCPVGLYVPNGYCLYDMHGNVEEWCADWLHWDYYSTSPRRDPSGPARGKDRVTRGGSWMDGSPSCRSAARGCRKPAQGGASILGFRVALDLPP